MTIELDFMPKLNQKINSLDLFARSTIGILKESESLSIMAMPGGSETVFFDGIRDKTYNVQINAKSRDQNNCLQALTKIYQVLENLEDLPSGNGSYDFQSIQTLSLPSILGRDEQGYWTYVLSIGAQITIYQGVEVNG